MNSYKNYTINTLEKICYNTGLSHKSIGILLRSFHISQPPLIFFAVATQNKYLAIFAISFFIAVVLLFFLFKGCFLTVLENKICNDDFTLIDPLLELLNKSINNSNRINTTYYVFAIYSFILFTIYYFRFVYSPNTTTIPISSNH